MNINNEEVRLSIYITRQIHLPIFNVFTCFNYQSQFTNFKLSSY